jgi:hypothetical protein
MNTGCGTVVSAALKRKPHDFGKMGRSRDEDSLGADPHSGSGRLRLVWRNLVLRFRFDPRMGLDGHPNHISSLWSDLPI